MSSCTEVDPEFHVYPIQRKRIEPLDEIQMRNNRGAIVATTYSMQVTKSLAGNFVNSLDVPT
jgi:hypothetical protein